MTNLEQFANQLRGPDWKNLEALELRTSAEVAHLMGRTPARVAEIEAGALLKVRTHLIHKLGELSH